MNEDEMTVDEMKAELAAVLAMVPGIKDGKRAYIYLDQITKIFWENPELMDEKLTLGVLRCLGCSPDDAEFNGSIKSQVFDLAVWTADKNVDHGKYALSRLAEWMASLPGDPEYDEKLLCYARTMETIVKYGIHPELAPHAANALAQHMPENIGDIIGVAEYLHARCKAPTEAPGAGELLKIDFISLFVSGLIAESEHIRNIWKGKTHLISKDRLRIYLYVGIDALVQNYPAARSPAMGNELLNVVELIRNGEDTVCARAAITLQILLQESPSTRSALDANRLDHALAFTPQEVQLAIKRGNRLMAINEAWETEPFRDTGSIQDGQGAKPGKLIY